MLKAAAVAAVLHATLASTRPPHTVPSAAHVPQRDRFAYFLFLLPLLRALAAAVVLSHLALGVARDTGLLTSRDGTWHAALRSLAQAAYVPGYHEWQGLQDAVYVLLACAGYALRMRTYAELGRFFTFELSVQQDHRLVTTGPYRWLRHPSYTGMVMVMVGMTGVLVQPYVEAMLLPHLLVYAPWLGRTAVAVALWAALAASLVPLLVWRVRDEESMLREHFGDDWDAFAAQRFGVLPGLTGWL